MQSNVTKKVLRSRKGNVSKRKKETSDAQLSGAEILLRSLVDEGVETIFGYPGGQALPIYDALYDSKINHILCRHEQGAAHAATAMPGHGQTGCLSRHLGTGRHNLVTGIANAFMDSVPMVAITGQVPQSLLGRDSFKRRISRGSPCPLLNTATWSGTRPNWRRPLKKPFTSPLPAGRDRFSLTFPRMFLPPWRSTGARIK